MARSRERLEQQRTGQPFDICRPPAVPFCLTRRHFASPEFTSRQVASPILPMRCSVQHRLQPHCPGNAPEFTLNADNAFFHTLKTPSMMLRPCSTIASSYLSITIQAIFLLFILFFTVHQPFGEYTNQIEEGNSAR